MATIRKHRGKWQAIVRRKGQGSASKTFHVKREAERWARNQELKLDNGTFGKLLPNEVTLADLLIKYRKTITVTKKGAPQETRRIQRLLNDPISSLAADQITSDRLASFRDRRLNNGTRAAAIDLILIGHCLRVSINEWGLSLMTNPADKVKRPAPPKARQRRLKTGEYEALELASKKTRNCYLWPLVILAIETGMRRSELLGLTWDSVDLKKRTALLKDTKNGDSRTVPLSERAASTINILPKNSLLLFPVSDNAIRLSWDKLKKRANLDDLRFHDLRHEAISRFFEKGLSLPEVALISGHKDPRMLFRYTHLRAEDIVSKLND
ncbi:site-specific recombinase XerD [alpha proteobacterium IMCC14465]|uniref:Site-specific recombinase XerD n=1 Tax=alpha proteobacterium IMCC14465 TaxID=1220535 RepID=J9DHK6_9PROT|nr:site-specific recombinase XerD [alpha proteobacterium IMCC14465]